MQTNRLGCLTGTGIMAALITAFVIGGYVYARGGLIYSPGPLNADSGPMLGGVASHADTGGECKACHTAFWERDIMADRCAVCHAEIASQMQDVAALHGVLYHKDPNLTCYHCHVEHRGAEAPLTVLKGAEFPHDAVGYSLNGHRQKVDGSSFTCDDCHNGDITTFASDSCQNCHRQMEAVFAQAHEISYGTACLDCHDGSDRFGENFSHNGFTFKLTGKHENVVCVKCHLDARKLADFTSASQDCYSCHRRDEPHEGRLGPDCGACHTSGGWTPAKFDHDLAAFKLEGAHTEAKCEQCHIGKVYKGTPMDCYSCHKQDDNHDGRFGTECSACHKPTDWDEATFDHNKSKFPLKGLHVDVACEKCHVNKVFQGLDTACVSCHADPGWHKGAFGTNCAACHNVFGWSDAKYRGGHPSFGEEGGLHHGGASCHTCHTATVYSATCRSCHKSNNPGDGGGGGD